MTNGPGPLRLSRVSRNRARNQAGSTPVRSTKYRASPTAVDGIRFASKKEASRYSELILLMKARKIQGLTLQPKFRISLNGKLICTYIADFEYWDVDRKKTIVEDVKGFRKIPTYRLKKKLVEAIYNLEITEI